MNQFVATYTLVSNLYLIYHNRHMNKQPSLLFCILMDAIGYASFALPVLGEASDIVWAPFLL